MPEHDDPQQPGDPGPIQLGPVRKIVPEEGVVRDPGPIEIDVIFKSEWATVTDPMAGRDLHLEHYAPHQASSEQASSEQASSEQASSEQASPGQPDAGQPDPGER
jgi:hypothetical protein